MKKELKKDNKKLEKSLLICKILTAVSIGLSLLSLLFGCASISSNANKKEPTYQINETNNLMIPNFNTELADPLGAFIVNNDIRSEINIGKLFNDPYNNGDLYLDPLFDYLSRYLAVDRTFDLAGSMRLVKYFSNDFTRVERDFYISDIRLTMNDEYDLYEADLTILESSTGAEGLWHIPSWNYELSYIEIGPIRWEYPFDLLNFVWVISYQNLDYNALPFYAWALNYSGIAYYLSLSRNFNYNLLLQEPTLNNLYSFARTPFINIYDYNLPNNYFNTSGGYFDIYIGNFSSNGYAFDTIRTYYKSAYNVEFYTPSSDFTISEIIKGTIGDYYVSSISYYHSLSDYELTAFNRKRELAYNSTTEGVNYKPVYGMNLEATYIGSYDLTLYTRNGFNDLQQYKYILTLLNTLSEGNSIAGGSVAGGNVFDEFFQLIYDIFASISPLLGISIFGTFTLGTFVFIPFVISFIMIIIKLFKR